MFDDYPVKYRLDSEIENVADDVRRRLFGSVVPGKTFFEGLSRFAGLKIIQLPDEQFGSYSAYVSVNPKRIFCKQSIYSAACRHDQIAGGVLAHEVGHYVLHPAKEIRFLATDGNSAPFHIHPNESAERQAWLFADALQMPSWSVWQVDDANDLADLCNVDTNRATQRWHQVRRTNNNLKSDPLSLDQEVWNAAEQIRGEDPAIFRKAGIYRIASTELDKMSHCGWFIREARAVAWISVDQLWF